MLDIPQNNALYSILGSRILTRENLYNSTVSVGKVAIGKKNVIIYAPCFVFKVGAVPRCSQCRNHGHVKENRLDLHPKSLPAQP